MNVSILLLCAATAFAQTRSPNVLKIWFVDGTGIEIYSESTGANCPVSRGGSETIPAGYDAHRLVKDKQGKILLGYDIEARKVGQDAFTVQIKPLKNRENIPTLSSTREFALLRVADSVQIDILRNPSTGERIYDVLKIPPAGHLHQESRTRSPPK